MNESMNAEMMSEELSVSPRKEKIVIGRKVPDEVKLEAVRRVTDCQESVGEVARDIGVSTSAIHNWRRSHVKALRDDSENGKLKEKVRELEAIVKEKDEELSKLRHEVEVAHRVRSEVVQDILKNR